MTLPQALPQLSSGPFVVAVPPVVFFWGIGILLGFFALFSIILVYHWSHYGYEKVKIGIVTVTYFLGGGILIALMLIGASAYLASV